MDHQGVWHSIPLVPGEMALYEGASCPHGRPVRSSVPLISSKKTQKPLAGPDSHTVPFPLELGLMKQTAQPDQVLACIRVP